MTPAYVSEAIEDACATRAVSCPRDTRALSHWTSHRTTAAAVVYRLQTHQRGAGGGGDALSMHTVEAVVVGYVYTIAWIFYYLLGYDKGYTW
jgi:hypothetical protein